MNDDFTIVLLGADGKIVTGSKDLFPNYLNLSEDKVAASNKWYQTWAAAETYRQNLKLTYEFMLNYTADRLWEKCLETYDTYSPEEQGGTLLFIIMMKKLVSATEAAVSYLQTTLEKMKLTDYEGENGQSCQFNYWSSEKIGGGEQCI